MTKAKKKVAARPKVRKPRGQLRTILDSAAASYANLLVDPCNAALVPPIFPGGGSGFLFRGESFFTLGTNVGNKAGFLSWTPSYVNSTSSEVVVGISTDGNTAVTAGTNSGAPARTFLSNNARAARCIAACLKVTFPGAESVRSGRIHFGHVAGGNVDVGDTFSPDAVAQLLVNYSRTPTDTIELFWKPDIADVEFTDPGAASSAVIKDRKSALAVAWAGLPDAVGLTFHLTAVYEWMPSQALGVGNNTKGKAVSRNTLDEVIDFVNSRFDWVKHNLGGLDMRTVVTTAAAFGAMPTVQRARAQRNLTG